MSSLSKPDQEAVGSLISITQLGIEQEELTNNAKLSFWRRIAIVVACCYIQFAIIGTCYSTGYYFVMFENEFKSGRSLTSLIGAVLVGLTFSTGPLSSIICNKFGHRKTTMLGGFIASIGLFIAAFCNSVWTLVCTFGALGGLGCGLAYIPCVVVPGYHFGKHNNAVIGFVYTVGASGSMLMPQIINLFLDNFGWRGTLIMKSGMMLNFIVAGALLRNPPNLSKHKNMCQVLDFSLMKDPQFLFILASEILLVTSSMIIWTIVPDMAVSREYHGGPSFFLTLMGISNIVSRLVISLVAAFQKWNRISFYAVITGVSVVPLLTITFFKNYYGMKASVVVYALAFGAQMCNAAPSAVQLYGLKRLTNAFGFWMLADGIACFLGPTIAGSLFDENNQDYHVTLLFSSGISAISTLIWTVIAVLHYKKTKQILATI